jgi:hypothetical protein
MVQVAGAQVDIAVFGRKQAEKPFDVLCDRAYNVNNDLPPVLVDP